MNFEAASALVSALETGITKTIFEPRKVRISMLRAARIKAAGIEYPAVIRNLSSTGMMAEVDAPLELGMEISLALANFGELRGTVRWMQGSRIGILDRKSVVKGKSVSVRVDLGGRRIIKKKKNI